MYDIAIMLSEVSLELRPPIYVDNLSRKIHAP